MSWPVLDARDTTRYGIFLRPDPLTCRVAAELHALLRAQFGLVAAAVFPPHVTLLGNVAVTRGEADLLERVEAVTRGVAPFELANPGPERRGGALVCEFHDARLTALAQAVEAALVDVRGRTDTDHLTGQTSTAAFGAHLTVAGQDLDQRPELAAEVAEFVRALAPPFPARARGAHVQVLRFHSATWPGRWWQDMTWQLLRSFPLDG